MKRLLSAVVLIIEAVYCAGQETTGPLGERFSVERIADSLEDPWQIRLDEKGHLWFTESRAFRVVRMNLTTKESKVLLDLNSKINYPRYDTIDDKMDGGKPWPQGGLMGLALHPDLFRGEPYVFLNYIFGFEGAAVKGKGCRGERGGCYFYARLVRYRFDAQKGQLTDPIIICDSIPASNDHNGSRIIICPVEGKNFLFYAIGDMGAGQFDNAGRPNRAQDNTAYEGKVLRFNIEPDKDQDRSWQWIPNDNPFNNEKQNAVWSFGHRNPQGLDYAVIGNRGFLYSSEHGPFSDDEINIIDKGKNYGHPLVIGFPDGNYNGLSAGVTSDSSLPNTWNTTYPDIRSETENAKAMGDAFRPPLRSLYPNADTMLRRIFRTLRQNDQNKQDWPAEAPSSIAIYTKDAIPGWKNSVLLTCLKTGRILRMKLASDGMDIPGDTIAYFGGNLRYRDIIVSEDGKTIYVAVDKSSKTSGPSDKEDKKTGLRGAILAFRYEGRKE